MSTMEIARSMCIKLACSTKKNKLKNFIDRRQKFLLLILLMLQVNLKCKDNAIMILKNVNQKKVVQNLQ